MRKAVVVALVCLVACSGGGASPTGSSTASRSPSVIPETSASSGIVNIPPPGSETLAGGCGVTEIYQRGRLPDWATVNAPKLVPYVDTYSAFRFTQLLKATRFCGTWGRPGTVLL
jgi:hypothetical protein